MPVYIIDKLNLDVLRKEQQRDRFCKNKVTDIKTKPDANFILDEHSILRKAVKLKYTVEPTIVLPKNLTNLTILEFHNAKGHHGISHPVHMMRCYFWWIGM